MSLTQAPSTDLDHAQLAAILRWYVDMGVDIAIEEEAQNRFLEVAKPAPGPVAAPQEAPRQPRAPQTFSANANSGRSVDAAAALSVEAAVQVARESAARATTLDELRAEFTAFEGCILKRSATNFVFADGDPKSRIMFIGDAPGDEDDRQGLPFTGPPGRLLERMLRSIKLDRNKVWLTNLLPWRVPGKRRATPQEIAVCLPFITRQIELIQPAILVCMGDDAAQTLMGLKGSVIHNRGVWQELTPGDQGFFRAIAILAPSYVLRASASKRMVWRDLIEIRKALNEVV
jgi:DNA polymerase